MSEAKKSDRMHLAEIVVKNDDKILRTLQVKLQSAKKSHNQFRENYQKKYKEFEENEQRRLEALEKEKQKEAEGVSAPIEREPKQPVEEAPAQPEPTVTAESAPQEPVLEQQAVEPVAEEATAQPQPISRKEQKKVAKATERQKQEQELIQAEIADYEDNEVKPQPGELDSLTVEDFKKASKKKADPPVAPVIKPTPSSTKTTSDKPSSGKKSTADNKEKRKNASTNNGNDKKLPNKKEKIKKGYEQNQASIEYDELSGEIKKVRIRKSFSEKKKVVPVVAAVIDHAVMNTEEITIKQLSEKIGKSVPEIMKKLVFEYSINKTINDNLDFDTAELIASDFGVTLKQELVKTNEEKLLELHEEADDEKDMTPRPPVVTVMGHVDHGKTSILDYIRKTDVAAGEAGGITQHIGAYTIQVPSEGKMRAITFLDTPGHEAFTAMRARGANLTDIAVIVVAADDGIMPQTVEAINHAKAANVQMIVAINKMDKPTANPDRILQQLSEHGVITEEWSGDTPVVRVSAKTGMNIKDLLETILLVADVKELKANPNRSASGTIVEARLDKGKGPVANVLIQNGTLRTGDFIVAGMAAGRVRAMFDDKGRTITKATPSTPVSILGLQEVPNAGDQMMVVVDEKLSKQVVEERKAREKIEKLKSRKVSLEEVMNRIEEGKMKELKLILKTDVQGSVEALKDSLIRLSNDEVKVQVIHSAVGAITESDVLLAGTSNAIIIGFNIRPDSNAKAMAEKDGVDIRLYRIIYDAIEDVNKAIHGLLAPTFTEVHLGRAEVRQLFRISGVGTIAGCMVKEGKISKNAQVRLLRDNVVVCETTVSSLRRLKDDVKEVQSGYDCGIGLTNYNDVHEGDVIEAFVMEENK